MNNGNINNNNKTNDKQVRCVREHEFTFEELHEAYISCKKNKRNTINALKFEIDLESNLQMLVDSLNNKTYKPTRSVCFSITDPKPREVFAADFKDRVVHHVLYNHLNPIYEKIFIYDTFACRKNSSKIFLF
jgi:RNA-directed DNA polymerase